MERRIQNLPCRPEKTKPMGTIRHARKRLGMGTRPLDAERRRRPARRLAKPRITSPRHTSRYKRRLFRKSPLAMRLTLQNENRYRPISTLQQRFQNSNVAKRLTTTANQPFSPKIINLSAVPLAGRKIVCRPFRKLKILDPTAFSLFSLPVPYICHTPLKNP